MFNAKNVWEIKLNTKGTYVPYFNKSISVNQICSMFNTRCLHGKKRRNVIKTNIIASIIFAGNPL